MRGSCSRKFNNWDKTVLPNLGWEGSPPSARSTEARRIPTWTAAAAHGRAWMCVDVRRAGRPRVGIWVRSGRRLVWAARLRAGVRYKQ